jgi:hypothetical protein
VSKKAVEILHFHAPGSKSTNKIRKQPDRIDIWGGTKGRIYSWDGLTMTE